MHTFWQKRTPVIIALKVTIKLALGAVVVAAVMLLWNWLMPAVFSGVRTIDYWQALGLLVLCRVLFGGGRGHGRWHARRRWGRMSMEERAQLKRHCGHGGDAA